MQPGTPWDSSCATPDVLASVLLLWQQTIRLPQEYGTYCVFLRDVDSRRSWLVRLTGSTESPRTSLPGKMNGGGNLDRDSVGTAAIPSNYFDHTAVRPRRRAGRLRAGHAARAPGLGQAPCNIHPTELLQPHLVAAQEIGWHLLCGSQNVTQLCHSVWPKSSRQLCQIPHLPESMQGGKQVGCRSAAESGCWMPVSRQGLQLLDRKDGFVPRAQIVPCARRARRCRARCQVVPGRAVSRVVTGDVTSCSSNHRPHFIFCASVAGLQAGTMIKFDQRP